MNDKSTEFLHYFSALKPSKNKLFNLLLCKEEGAFVYYIAPITNILKVHQSGGILPRNLAQGYFDVSSDAIQKRREGKISISGVGRTKSVNLHDCVNLFLNPINLTFFQFRRNAIIRSAIDDKWSQVIGILEVDLSKLLESDDIYWHINGENLAGRGANGDALNYNNFAWDEIYDLTPSHTRRDGKDKQAAEWIAYSENAKIAPTIPMNCITRMIVLGDDLVEDPKVLRDDLDLEISIFAHTEDVRALQDPISEDKRWLSNLTDLIKTGTPIDTVVKTLVRIAGIEREIGLSLRSSYPNDDFATNDTHGMRHEIRVMFWGLFLAEEARRLGSDLSDMEITAVLYAAFIHDLGRSHDGINEQHGMTAANKFKDHLKPRLDQTLLGRCLNAVRVHSLNEDPIDKDILWELLKDADALDRGRFSPPINEKGCESKYLRSQIFKDPKTIENITWAAYYLPRVSRYISWTENPCLDFVQTVLASLDVAAHARDVSDEGKKVAMRIIDATKLAA